jgi:hypothetical protein
MGSKTRPRRSPRRAKPCARPQSRGHSAHIGQDVVTHYRWHPLCGNEVAEAFGYPKRQRRSAQGMSGY